MATELVAKGDRLFVDEDYNGAISAYCQAAEADPNNARIFAARAHAYIKLEDWMAAVEDAARAVQLDPTLSSAYLRHGIALFNLEEYESAKHAFEEGSRLAPDTAAFKTWVRKCQAELDDEDSVADVKHDEHTAKSAAKPAATTSRPVPAPSPPAASVSSVAPAVSYSAADVEKDAPLLKPPAGLPEKPEGKYRHQWYQLQNKVTVDVYAKNLNKDLVSCSFEEDHMTFVVKDASGTEEYALDVDLYGKVIPSGCRCEVLRSKVEITLTKAEPIQWGSLERSAKVVALSYGQDLPAPPKPYSSRKDWDKVDSELEKQAKAGELDEGDPLNNFFKKIFSQGDEDTQRAMKKSFLESNGTVLSTNWQDVGKKKVECTPPEGMVVKKYE